jgi:WD40 repeat protein
MNPKPNRNAVIAGAIVIAVLAAAAIGFWCSSRGHEREALLFRARAASQGTAPDRRFLAMAALERAARIRPGPDLREEYLRCLELPGLRPFSSLQNVPDQARSAFLGERFAFCGADDRLLRVLEASAASTASPGAPVIFEVSSGRAVTTLTQVPEFWQVIALSEDGRWLLGIPRIPNVQASPDQPKVPAQLWNLNEQRLVGEILSEKAPDWGAFAVRHAAFNLKSNRLAVAKVPDMSTTYGSKLSVYELDSLSPVASWEITNRVVNLAFHPERPFLAASVLHYEPRSSGNSFEVQQLCLWDILQREAVATLTLVPAKKVDYSMAEGLRQSVLAFSPGGEVVMAGSCNGSIKVWDLAPLSDHGLSNDSVEKATPKEILSIPAHAGPVTAIRLSPDGRWLASLGADRRLKLWDAATGKLACEERIDSEEAHDWGSTIRTALEWSPSGRFRLSGASDSRSLQIREFIPPLSVVQRHPWPVRSLVFSPDDRYLTGGEAAQLIELDKPSARRTWFDRGGTADAQAFSHDLARLWTVSSAYEQECRTALYHVSSRTNLATQEDVRRVQAIAFDTSGRRVAAGREHGGVVQVIDLDTAQELWKRTVRTVSLGFMPKAEFLWAPDSTRLTARFPLATYYPPPQVIKSWDWSTGQELAEQKGDWKLGGLWFLRGETFDPIPDSVWEELRRAKVNHHDVQRGFAYSGNGALAAITVSNSIRLFQTSPWQMRSTVRSSNVIYGPLRLNHAGTRLAAFDGGELKLWDAVEGKELGKVKVEYAPPFLVESATEGEHLLLVESKDRTVLSWRPGNDLKPVCILERTEPPVAGIDPQGRAVEIPLRIYSPLISQDGARVLSRWSTFSGSCVAAWSLPSGKLFGCWSVAGQVAGSEDRSVCFSPDAKRFAILSPSSSDKVWDADTERELFSLESPGLLRLSRDGRYLLSRPEKATTSDRGISFHPMRVYDLTTQSLLSTFKDDANGGESPPHLALADDARLLILGRGDFLRLHEPRTGTTRTFQDSRTGKPTEYLKLPSGRLTALALDGSASTLACATDDGFIRLLNPWTGEELAALQTDQTWETLALSPSAHWLAAADKGGLVRFWNLAAARRQLRQAGLDGPTAKSN